VEGQRCDQEVRYLRALHVELWPGARTMTADQPQERGAGEVDRLEHIKEWHAKRHAGQHRDGSVCETMWSMQTIETLRARNAVLEAVAKAVREFIPLRAEQRKRHLSFRSEDPRSAEMNAPVAKALSNMIGALAALDQHPAATSQQHDAY